MSARKSPDSQHPAPHVRPRAGLRLILLGTAVVLFCYGLMWGLPNLFDFAQDSVVPIGKLAEKGFDFEEVTARRYPPFHFYVLRLLFLPLRALLAVAGWSANPKISATAFILTARLASLAMGLGALTFLYETGRRLWGERAGFAGALLFLLSPATLYYARNANLDMPYLLWMSATLYYYVRVLQNGRRRDYLWLGLMAALAVCTKDQAYGFLLLMPLPILWTIRARAAKDGGAARGEWRSAARGALVAAGAFALIHNLLFDWAGFVEHVRVITGPGSEGWRMTTRNLAGQARLLVETLLCLLDTWTVAGVALAALGVAWACLRSGPRTPCVGQAPSPANGSQPGAAAPHYCLPGGVLCIALLAPVISYYLSFLAVVGYVVPRFTLPMMLPLALFGGAAAAELWERGRGKRILAAVLVGWVGLAGLSLDYVMGNYSRYDAQIWMQNNLDPSLNMCYLGEMRDMPRFNAPLDPRQCEPNAEALAALHPKPDVLVISLAAGDRAAGWLPMRASSLLRRHLGGWGRLPASLPGGPGTGFHERLVSGEMGYRVLRSFRNPIAPFVPETSESVNRTILVLVREDLGGG